MELFPAADEEQWSLIRRVIDECDYYIVISAGRYGSLCSDGVGFTQKEYEYAISCGKPTIAFVHRDIGKIPTEKTESTDDGKARLTDFREILRQKVCKDWSTAQELGSVVSRSLVQLIKSRPAIGWIRGNVVSSEAASREILDLRKKVEELQKQLDSLSLRPPEGSERLAQGNDTFEIHFDYQLQAEGHDTKATVSDSLILTWDNIFESFAPCMINVVSNSTLRDRLKMALAVSNREKVKREHGEKATASICGIKDRDFEAITIQLRALGLITQGTFTNDKGISVAGWTLTEYGDRELTRACAIQRS